MYGIITTIQRMSIHDGPGIRSTIFLKGCNLRCIWCHNPETFLRESELEWLKQKCIGCNSCVAICKSGTFSLSKKQIEFKKENCNNCFACLDVCYSGAIVKVGQKVSPEEVFAEVEQDFLFFRNSGGGVTISGGEPMLQPEFTSQTLALFKQAGIHTALDTNLSISWKHYEKVLLFTDLVLADLKLMSRLPHKKWTGQSNLIILKNLQKLDDTGIPYIVRTPVVPGINDNEEEIKALAKFISSLKNIQKLELLPFHSMGNFKYTNLKIKNPMGNTEDLSKERLEYVEKILKQ